MKFTIYPKKGEPFELEFQKFDFDGKTFALYDSNNAPFVRGSFLSASHVAAIIPARDKDRLRSEMRFNIHLRNRTHPIEIDAAYFEPESQTADVFFYWQPLEHGTLQKKKIENVYVAWSAVVAIVPLLVSSPDSEAL